jgi:hypothetical protein
MGGGRSQNMTLNSGCEPMLGPLFWDSPYPRALPYIEVLNIGINSYSLGDI